MTARVLRDRLLFAACLCLMVAASAEVSRTQTTDVSIFVSVIDGAGDPVTGLTAAEFAIREDGTEREIVAAKPATDPLRIALLADTSDAGDEDVQEARAGLKAFIQGVLGKSPDAQIGLWEFGQAAVRIHPFSSDAASLEKTASRIFPKPNAASVLLEALYDTSEALGNGQSPRRAIVLLNVEPSNEQSRQEPQRLNDSLMRSRAQVWALSVQKGAMRNAQRDVLLNTLVRNAGGRREYIVAASAIETYLRQYAAALTAQYEVTYKRPAGRLNIVQTGVRREGARAIAGIFAPR